MKLIINEYGCFTEEEFEQVQKYLNGEIAEVIVDGRVYKNHILISEDKENDPI